MYIIRTAWRKYLNKMRSGIDFREFRTCFAPNVHSKKLEEYIDLCFQFLIQLRIYVMGFSPPGVFAGYESLEIKIEGNITNGM